MMLNMFQAISQKLYQCSNYGEVKEVLAKMVLYKESIFIKEKHHPSKQMYDEIN